MYVHNFYADLLLSVRVLFDNYIFQNRNYAKRYEFNMGNRAIQLPYDYKPNFEFPNLIVTLNDEVPSYGQRPTVSQNLAGFNLDQIPVLYNQSSQITILVQEEMVNIPITIVINCESQFQAKEAAVMVRRWLPINKFINFFNFTSYLEISSDFLSSSLFEPSIQSIANLYTKLNKRTGDIDFCYSLQYEPMIRLDSCSTSIPDSTQRSFQVTVDITYMMPMPLYMFSDVAPGTVEKIDISINPSTGFEPINDYPSSKIINYLNSDVDSLKKGFIRRTFLVSDDTSIETTSTLDSVVLEVSQVTNTSVGGEDIEVTRGSDEYLYITIGDSETQYKVDISELVVDEGTVVTLSTDEYLEIEKDLAGEITVSLKTLKESLTIQFDPTDFPLTTDYSYNLVNGSNILRDYTEYTLDLDANSITFFFDESEYSSYAPSITSPLIIQFYLKNTVFPFQLGGVIPIISLMKVFNIRQTAAEITWTSGEQTTTQVEYGITTDYGSLSTLKEDYTNLHKVVLTGLTAGTTYHYRLKVTDTDGDECLSDDYTFTTLS